MRLGEGNDRARLERHDGHVHVVAHVGGIDEARRRPARRSVPGIGVGAISCLVGEEGFRRVEALDRLVGLANPVEAGGAVPSLRTVQSLAGGMKANPPGRRLCFLPASMTRQLALDHEQRAFGAGIGLRPVAAAAGRDLHDVLRERLGKARQRSRQHPERGSCPRTAGRWSRCPHHALGDDGIGLGEDGATGQKFGLPGQPPCGAVIRFGSGHS